jgi:hypothetical protein
LSICFERLGAAHFISDCKPEEWCQLSAFFGLNPLHENVIGSLVKVEMVSG